MKHDSDCNTEKNPGLQRRLRACQKLRNFCRSYNFIEADELLCRVLITMLAGNYSLQNSRSRAALLVYFEALEDVLPALYELHEQLHNTEKQQAEENMYTDLVSAKDLFAALKRHPE